MPLTPAGHVLDADTFALWRFEDAVATALAEEKGLYPGTAYAGAPAIVNPGMIGKGRYFAALPDYIGCASDAALRNLIIGNNWTAEFWAKIPSGTPTNKVKGLWVVNDPATAASPPYLFGCSFFGLTGAFIIYTGAGNVQGAYVLPLDQWLHIAILKKPDASPSQCLIDVYVNGVQRESNLLGGNWQIGVQGTPTSTNTFNFGRGYRHTQVFLDSGPIYLDDFRLSNKLRSGAEILDSYNRGAIGIDETPPAAPTFSYPTEGLIINTTPIVGTNGNAIGPIQVTGFAEIGSTVDLKLDGAGITGAAFIPVDPYSGRWTYQLGGVLIGPHILSARASDDVGNGSAFTPVGFEAWPPAEANYPWQLIADDGIPGAGVVRDFALDKYGDLYLDDNGEIAVTYGRAAILSDIHARLGTFLGEHFLDTSIGWISHTSVLGKGGDLTTIRGLIRQEIEKTPGVLSVKRVELLHNPSTRVLAVAFEASSEVGELAATVEI